jgi:hypothetical protein
VNVDRIETQRIAVRLDKRGDGAFGATHHSAMALSPWFSGAYNETLEVGVRNAIISERSRWGLLGRNATSEPLTM